MPISTIIYGSAVKREAETRESVNGAEKGAAPESMMANAQKLASNPLTLPLAPLAMLVASIQQGGDLLGSPMAARKFSDRGSLVQTMSTSDLDRKNIFGSGGSS